MRDQVETDHSQGPAAGGAPGPAFNWWWFWALVAALGAVVGVALAIGARPAEPPATAFTVKQPEEAPSGAGVLRDVRFQITGSHKEAMDLIPAGVTEVAAMADLGSGDEGAPVTVKWWWAGDAQEAPAVERKTSSGGTTVTAVLRLPGDRVPFTPGVGEVEFHKSGERVARGSFVVCADAAEILAQADANARPTVVDSVQTSRGVAADGAPTDPADRFAPNDRVYVVFRYRLAEPGTEFRVNWYAGGAEIGRAQARIVADSPEGWGHAWLHAAGSGLPSGKYEARVTYGTSAKSLGEASFRVSGRGDASSSTSP